MSDRLSPTLLSHEAYIRHASHRLWLSNMGRKLLNFDKKAKVNDGFSGLSLKGELPSKARGEATLTARAIHIYSVAALQGIPGSHSLASHGVEALRTSLKDTKNGGWKHFANKPKDRKQAYLHAFVALGASSATLIDIDGADELLRDAIDQIETHFWSDEEGVMRESFAADWSDEENYRGANSNMHSTEAFMALADVTGDVKWLHRALRIVTRFVHELASQQGFAMPEHFDRQWKLLKDYNKDEPYDSLRPYGMTPGHFFEWAHLTLKLEAALLRRGEKAPEWMLHDAQSLFETGINAGWSADGKPGIVYTVDWKHKPHVTERAHWVEAEALTAAINLFKRTGNIKYEYWYRTFWDYIDTTLVDREYGSWFNEVSPSGKPSEKIYKGKADLYHAYQATIAPLMPLAPSLATAIKQIGVQF
ncbi:AGE family epimerase/isomerase [Swingsia samuiensis]|uniref:AGE family epimerase/isomerase n=1 Tax=Swingsia samuiensis TaxID=1293412 RepID=A0A4Y6UHT8_9PROT|nr:AGE family epimerase/isomerase [Swingsia samuiensis]QDH17143.1 AGE family epimerase/isomerase [Swingsia samuiensis]